MSDPRDPEPKIAFPPGLEPPRRSYGAAEPDQGPSFADPYGYPPEGEDERSREPAAEPLDMPVADSNPARSRAAGNGQTRRHPPTRASTRIEGDWSEPWSRGAQADAADATDPRDSFGERETSDLKISLWGSPQSGKTTYLAALRDATTMTNNRSGKWNVFPMNQQSSRLMAELTNELRQGKFPNSTLPGEEIPLQWMFVGDITESQFVRRRDRLFRRGPLISRFVLDLMDVSGRAFAHNPAKESVPSHVADASMKRLSAADGFLYLFDPIGERDNRDSYTYVNRVITELRHRAVSGRYTPHHLPQHVSVCITKFDDPAVFQEARDNGLVNYGPDGMPRVLDQHAEDFFELLCTDNFWRTRFEESARSADLIRRELRSVFSPAQVRYFVTSSVGFYQGMGWQKRGSRFDPDDFQNVLQGAGNMPEIRGPINPVNVLEPLISLQQRIMERE